MSKSKVVVSDSLEEKRGTRWKAEWSELNLFFFSFLTFALSELASKRGIWNISQISKLVVAVKNIVVFPSRTSLSFASFSFRAKSRTSPSSSIIKLVPSINKNPQTFVLFGYDLVVVPLVDLSTLKCYPLDPLYCVIPIFPLSILPRNSLIKRNPLDTPLLVLSSLLFPLHLLHSSL